jgi:hypothetical protein
MTNIRTGGKPGKTDTIPAIASARHAGQPSRPVVKDPNGEPILLAPDEIIINAKDAQAHIEPLVDEASRTGTVNKEAIVKHILPVIKRLVKPGKGMKDGGEVPQPYPNAWTKSGIQLSPEVQAELAGTKMPFDDKSQESFEKGGIVQSLKDLFTDENVLRNRREIEAMKKGTYKGAEEKPEPEATAQPVKQDMTPPSLGNTYNAIKNRGKQIDEASGWEDGGIINAPTNPVVYGKRPVLKRMRGFEGGGEPRLIQTEGERVNPKVVDAVRNRYTQNMATGVNAAGESLTNPTTENAKATRRNMDEMQTQSGFSTSQMMDINKGIRDKGASGSSFNQANTQVNKVNTEGYGKPNNNGVSYGEGEDYQAEDKPEPIDASVTPTPPSTPIATESVKVEPTPSATTPTVAAKPAFEVAKPVSTKPASIVADAGNVATVPISSMDLTGQHNRIASFNKGGKIKLLRMRGFGEGGSPFHIRKINEKALAPTKRQFEEAVNASLEAAAKEKAATSVDYSSEPPPKISKLELAPKGQPLTEESISYVTKEVKPLEAGLTSQSTGMVPVEQRRTIPRPKIERVANTEGKYAIPSKSTAIVPAGRPENTPKMEQAPRPMTEMVPVEGTKTVGSEYIPKSETLGSVPGKEIVPVSKPINAPGNVDATLRGQFNDAAKAANEAAKVPVEPVAKSATPTTKSPSKLGIGPLGVVGGSALAASILPDAIAQTAIYAGGKQDWQSANMLRGLFNDKLLTGKQVEHLAKTADPETVKGIYRQYVHGTRTPTEGQKQEELMNEIRNVGRVEYKGRGRPVEPIKEPPAKPVTTPEDEKKKAEALAAAEKEKAGPHYIVQDGKIVGAQGPGGTASIWSSSPAFKGGAEAVMKGLQEGKYAMHKTGSPEYLAEQERIANARAENTAMEGRIAATNKHYAELDAARDNRNAARWQAQQDSLLDDKINDIESRLKNRPFYDTENNNADRNMLRTLYGVKGQREQLRAQQEHGQQQLEVAKADKEAARAIAQQNAMQNERWKQAEYDQRNQLKMAELAAKEKGKRDEGGVKTVADNARLYDEKGNILTQPADAEREIQAEVEKQLPYKPLTFNSTTDKEREAALPKIREQYLKTHKVPGVENKPEPIVPKVGAKYKMADGTYKIFGGKDAKGNDTWTDAGASK